MTTDTIGCSECGWLGAVSDLQAHVRLHRPMYPPGLGREAMHRLASKDHATDLHNALHPGPGEACPICSPPQGDDVRNAMADLGMALVVAVTPALVWVLGRLQRLLRRR